MPRHELIFTIGHSTRPLDELVALLARNGVTQLADVRTVPKSRAGIVYRHFPGLGGLRKPRPDSTNTAWRNQGFRGYADYMQTPGFAQALDDLLVWSTSGLRAEADQTAGEAIRRATAIMCAEAVWWQCHRQLIADALVARGVEVRHIVSTAAPEPHRLTEFARVEATRVTYPGLV
jgi:uncharacterized protein (DUF488 family)